MSFTQAIKSCWSKYATFSGRAPRSEYWFFQLFIFLCIMALGVLALIFGALGSAVGGDQQANAAGAGAGIGIGLVGLLGILFLFAVIVPQLAVSVRRIHDTGASGWLVLLYFIPYLGGLIAIVWGCIPGTPGPNAYGPSPFETPADTFN